MCSQLVQQRYFHLKCSQVRRKLHICSLFSWHKLNLRGCSNQCQSFQPWLRTVPANTEIFLQGYDYRGKADLSKGFWDLQTKMWVTMHVSVWVTTHVIQATLILIKLENTKNMAISFQI